MWSHPAALPEEALLRDCRVTATRRRGPGGQHRNKTATAIVIEHIPSGLRGEASERRSQAENRRVALGRLRTELALCLRQRLPDGPGGPSPMWQARCRGGQLEISRRHADFPALLAEALDVLWACEVDARSAALQLRCTPSQLVKLLRREPRALEFVNRQRAARGLRPLK